MADVMERSDGRAAGTDGDELPLFLELRIADPETVRELLAHAEGPARDEFAQAALRIGVLALRQARGQIDAEVIQRETQRMLAALERQLGDHARGVHDRLAGSLKEYFDPESGRLNERIRRLVERDGELERVLRAQIGGQDSELCKTLLSHVGEQSPLMKLLHPQQSQGLLAALRGTVDEQLAAQREHVLKQFSLDNKEGALSRLVQELQTGHGQLAEALQDKIDEVVREFSLDEEDSALSRLVRNVERAQQTISNEFSLDNEQSAFCRLKSLLENTTRAIHSNLTLDDDQSSLARLKREVMTILSAQSETNSRFQEEVKTSLARMLARREEAERSTRHGLAFEGAVCEYVEAFAQRVGDVAVRVSTTTGLVRGCKVGDVLLEMGADSAAPGARLVIEAKEEAGYTLARARDECQQARKNRGAQIGLFVFSKKVAPAGLEDLVRHGEDLLVAWDAEDAATDVQFKAALGVARALCVRAARQSEAQAADFQAIDKAINEVEKQTELLAEIHRASETIKSSNEKIANRVRISREALERQVETLREKLTELKQTLGSGGAEK